jgi:biotin operon repressor
MEEVKNNWCVIPNYIWKHPDLTLVEKCLLGRIVALSTEKGYCYAGNSYLAEELDKSAKTISHIISSLVDRGFLIRDVSRNKKNEIEQRRVRINEIGIRAVFQQEVANPLDTPIPENGNTLYPKMGIPIPENGKERIDITIDKRIDIYKQEKKTKVTLELEEFVSTYNATYKRNIGVPSGDKGWVKNFKKWREDYSLEQIKEAVVLSRNHQFYKDKLTPDMLFRLNEDRISLFLNTPKPKTREEIYTEEFNRLWESAI